MRCPAESNTCPEVFDPRIENGAGTYRKSWKTSSLCTRGMWTTTRRTWDVDVPNETGSWKTWCTESIPSLSPLPLALARRRSNFALSVPARRSPGDNRCCRRSDSKACARRAESWDWADKAANATNAPASPSLLKFDRSRSEFKIACSSLT